MEEQANFKPTLKMILISTMVEFIPPFDDFYTPITFEALFKYKTMNSS